MRDDLEIQIGSEELCRLLLARSDAHARKADLYAAKAAEKLRDKADAVETMVASDDLDEEDKDRQYMSNRVTSDTGEYVRKAKTHKERATYLRFIATHLMPEVYKLTAGQVTEFELAEA